MSDSISLFSELKSSGYSACLMSSFTVNFPYYEEVLLRRMRASGVDHHVLLVDKAMCLSALNRDRPQRAGSDYVLAPMDCPVAFHPKVILLLGKDKGLLAVGSNNVTLAGYGQNLEISNVFRFHKTDDRAHLHLFKSAFSAFKDWVVAYGGGLPASVGVAVDRTTNLCPWLNDDVDTEQVETSRVAFFYSSGTEKSLWEQVTTLLPLNIDTGIGVSAFFDSQLRFVDTLASLGARKLYLGVQPSTVSAPPSLAEYTGVNLVDVNSLLHAQGDKRYSHAKALYLSGDSPLLISGSANFSYPAWHGKGNHQNAEAVIAIVGQKATEIVEQLGFLDLSRARAVVEIMQRPLEEPDDCKETVELMLVDTSEGEASVCIPMRSHWGGGHRLVCVDRYDREVLIDARKRESDWQISAEVFKYHRGQIIHVMDNDVILAKVIVLVASSIFSRCGTANERAVSEAFKSLYSDSPSLQFIFSHLETITRESAEASHEPTTRKSTRPGSTSLKDVDRTSLIEAMPENNSVSSDSGRHRVGHSTVLLTLDMLSYVIRLGGAQAQKDADEEDPFGEFNENDDDEDDLPAVVPAKAEDDPARRLKTKTEVDRFRRRLEGLLGKECKRFEQTPPSEKKLAHHVTVTLSFIALAHEMICGQDKYEYVGKTFLVSLCNFLFDYVLTDKDPVNIEHKENDFSVYRSEEWTRLLAHAVWLSYSAGISLRVQLPVSATIEDQDIVVRDNARWLYLAQRVTADKSISEYAISLLQDFDPHSTAWFHYLQGVCNALNDRDLKSLPNNLVLALSPYDGFEGFRVVKSVDGDMVELGTISSAKKVNRFSVLKLQLLKCGKEEKFIVGRMYGKTK